MPPELQGTPPRFYPASDIYSLGKTMEEVAKINEIIKTNEVLQLRWWTLTRKMTLYVRWFSSDDSKSIILSLLYVFLD